MIRKRNGKYVVLSETTGRSFGSHQTLAEAKKRLRQIEFFKWVKKNSALVKVIQKKKGLRKRFSE